MLYSTEGLAAAGLNLVPPFTVALCLDPEQDVNDQPDLPLLYKSVARVLPGRRLAGIAEFQGQTVFAKLFYGKGARRYWSRERHGAQLMANAGTRTPPVLFSGATSDGKGFVVLYAAIPNPTALAEDDLPQILAATEQVALLHEHNLMQTDIHLNNFVVSSQQVHLVDADGVRAAAVLRRHFRNLACFLAQRAPWFDHQIEAVWAAYVAVRGEYVANMGSTAKLRELTLAERERRIAKYLQKTQRECTEFVQRKKFKREFLCDRNHWPRLQRFLLFPEVYLGEGTPLKLGNSATVVRCEIEGERYVVKRYNIKNFGHRVRRWFKRRARNAWCNGHWLEFLGIATARPVALLEQRVGPLVGVSYLVMLDVGDRDLGQVLSSEPEAFEQVAIQTCELLTRLQAARIIHGDLKATNLIERVNTARETEQRQMVLIDFDALSSGVSDKDKVRFMANWQDDPQLYQAWQAKLVAAGL